MILSTGSAVPPRCLASFTSKWSCSQEPLVFLLRTRTLIRASSRCGEKICQANSSQYSTNSRQSWRQRFFLDKQTTLIWNTRDSQRQLLKSVWTLPMTRFAVDDTILRGQIFASRRWWHAWSLREAETKHSFCFVGRHANYQAKLFAKLRPLHFVAHPGKPAQFQACHTPQAFLQINRGWWTMMETVEESNSDSKGLKEPKMNRGIFPFWFAPRFCINPYTGLLEPELGG